MSVSSLSECKVLARRVVAALRFTAVGRAVSRNDKISPTCAFRASDDDRKSGGGEASNASERWKATERDARDAIAGAPRI
jgi:hypothetical protein